MTEIDYSRLPFMNYNVRLQFSGETTVTVRAANAAAAELAARLEFRKCPDGRRLEVGDVQVIGTRAAEASDAA